jgi:hypothetical protein
MEGCCSKGQNPQRAVVPVEEEEEEESHKRHNFRKKVTEHKMCVLISYTT